MFQDFKRMLAALDGVHVDVAVTVPKRSIKTASPSGARASVIIAAHTTSLSTNTAFRPMMLGAPVPNLKANNLHETKSNIRLKLCE